MIGSFNFATHCSLRDFAGAVNISQKFNIQKNLRVGKNWLKWRENFFFVLA